MRLARDLPAHLEANESARFADLSITEAIDLLARHRQWRQHALLLGPDGVIRRSVALIVVGLHGQLALLWVLGRGVYGPHCRLDRPQAVVCGEVRRGR
jgi:hypothetical protein